MNFWMVKSRQNKNICEERHLCRSFPVYSSIHHLTCHYIRSLSTDKEREDGRSRWKKVTKFFRNSNLCDAVRCPIHCPQKQWIWATYSPSTIDTWKNDIRLRSIILPRRLPRWKAVKIYRVLPTPILMSCFAVSSFDRSDFKNLKFNVILFSAKSYLWQLCWLLF